MDLDDQHQVSPHVKEVHTVRIQKGGLYLGRWRFRYSGFRILLLGQAWEFDLGKSQKSLANDPPRLIYKPNC